MDNNKELVSGDELFPLVKGWVNQVASSRLDIQLGTSSFLKNNRVWFYLTDTNFGNMYRYIAMALIKDHWVIYNDWYAEEFINIRIFKDNIEFNEDSTFTDFTREEMYNLYTLLKEIIFNNKEPISQDKLFSLIDDYRISHLDGNWESSSGDGYFYFCYRFPRDSVEDSDDDECSENILDVSNKLDSIDRVFSNLVSNGVFDKCFIAHLKYNHWEIYTDKNAEHANIRIYNGCIVFNEDSKFTDISKEEMYNLYTFLNERLFGVKENKEENNNEKID
jgi:hypothetical protein